MKFRKKPVVIDAIQWTGENLGEIEAFAGRDVAIIGGVLFVNTLEKRNLEADKGDWIIRGVKGEFYPCKDEIFRMTYELAE